MPTVNPTQITDGTTIDASDVNTPINQLADAINGDLDADNLATNAVSTGKIQDSAVTTAKIADDAVTPAKRSGGFWAGKISFSTGTGTQAITGIGFQPKMIQCFTGRNSSAVTTTFGYAYDTGSGITQGGRADTINTTPSVGSDSQETAAFVQWSSSDTVDFRAVVTSFDSDGFTVNKTTGATGTILDFHVMAFA